MTGEGWPAHERTVGRVLARWVNRPITLRVWEWIAVVVAARLTRDALRWLVTVWR